MFKYVIDLPLGVLILALIEWAEKCDFGAMHSWTSPFVGLPGVTHVSTAGMSYACKVISEATILRSMCMEEQGLFLAAVCS